MDIVKIRKLVAEKTGDKRFEGEDLLHEDVVPDRAMPVYLGQRKIAYSGHGEKDYEVVFCDRFVDRVLVQYVHKASTEEEVAERVSEFLNDFNTHYGGMPKQAVVVFHHDKSKYGLLAVGS